ncbi:hypothetical protein ACJJTC_012584 [Scirpophaga incertulas]
MKLAAKANLSHHYKETFLTRVGSKPPLPSPENLQIMAIAPHDFVMNVNNFDSDAAIPNQPAIVDGPNAGPSSEEPLICGRPGDNVKMRNYLRITDAQVPRRTPVSNEVTLY